MYIYGEIVYNGLCIVTSNIFTVILGYFVMN